MKNVFLTTGSGKYPMSKGIEMWSELGDREGQRFAVPAAVTTEVSGEVGGSVHGNLGGPGS